MKAIVLGGTIPHKYLIENLKKRGYYTILADYYENPPAKISADEYVQISTLDIEAVYNLAKNRNVDLVISGCVDQANVTACYVSEKLGLPIPYSYETSLRVTDKELMKEGLLRAGVKTAAHEVIIEKNAPSYKSKDFPKVVKPCDTNGSKGVRKVNNQSELSEALIEACKLSTSKKAIVENYNSGFEINGYYFVGNDEVSEIYIKRKKLPEISGIESLQSFISFGPENLSDSLRETIKETVFKIASEFNLKNTPLLLQANVEKDNISVIEFAPRVGGGLAFREIELLTGFSMIDAVIDSYLNKDVMVRLKESSDEIISIVHLYGKEGILSHVEGLDEMKALGHLVEYHLHKSKGMKVSDDDLSSRNRILGLIIMDKSVDGILHRLKHIIENIEILSEGGSCLLRKSLVMTHFRNK